MASLVKTLFIVTVLAVCDNSAQNIRSCVGNLGDKVHNCQRSLPPTVVKRVGKIGSNITLLLQNVDMFCPEAEDSQRDVRKALGCVYDVSLSCIPEHLHNVIPTKEQTQDALGNICKKIKDIDGNCLASGAKNFSDCVVPALQLNNATRKDFYRSFIPVGKRCFIEAFDQCNGSTTGTILADELEKQKPAVSDLACNTLSSSLLILTLLVLAYQYLT